MRREIIITNKRENRSMKYEKASRVDGILKRLYSNFVEFLTYLKDLP